jgi:hypothetical protein
VRPRRQSAEQAAGGRDQRYKPRVLDVAGVHDERPAGPPAPDQQWTAATQGDRQGLGEQPLLAGLVAQSVRLDRVEVQMRDGVWLKRVAQCVVGSEGEHARLRPCGHDPIADAGVAQCVPQRLGAADVALDAPGTAWPFEDRQRVGADRRPVRARGGQRCIRDPRGLVLGPGQQLAGNVGRLAQHVAHQFVEVLGLDDRRVDAGRRRFGDQLLDARHRRRLATVDPEQASGEAAVDGSLLECVHHRRVAAAVAAHDQPVASAGAHEGSAQASVLLAQLLADVLEPHRLEVAVELAGERPALFGDRLLGQVGVVERGDREVGGRPEHARAAGLDRGVEVRRPHDPRALGGDEHGQAGVAEARLDAADLRVDVRTAVLLVGVGELEVVGVLRGVVEARMAAGGVEVTLDALAQCRVAEVLAGRQRDPLLGAEDRALELPDHVPGRRHSRRRRRARAEEPLKRGRARPVQPQKRREVESRTGRGHRSVVAVAICPGNTRRE